MSDYVVCAMYKFVTLENYQAMRQPLLNKMLQAGVRGTLLLANEGINGTVAGTREGMDQLLSYIKTDPRLADIDTKESYNTELPFNRAKVKLKKEIVTLGVENVDPNKRCGEYVEPEDWNDVITDPDVLVIDTRNEYEIQIGTFKNAVNPHTESFRELPEFVDDCLDKNKHKKIAMFCTGGIRCEKSTALMKEKGFEKVYHLKGGILKYLEKVPQEKSLWEGECFVFDSRVAVNQNLEKGQYDQCFACRMPITEADKNRSEYAKGVSCHHCFYDSTDEQKQRFAERQRQSEIAKSRGESHIGSDAQQVAEIRRELKQQMKEKTRSA